MTTLLDNIRTSLVGLKMPRALEALDHTVQRLEKGEIGALEAIDDLLGEEFTLREGRRIGMALMTAKLTPPKTLESFDFTFQPSLDRDRRGYLCHPLSSWQRPCPPHRTRSRLRE